MIQTLWERHWNMQATLFERDWKVAGTLLEGRYPNGVFATYQNPYLHDIKLPRALVS